MCICVGNRCTNQAACIWWAPPQTTLMETEVNEKSLLVAYKSGRIFFVSWPQLRLLTMSTFWFVWILFYVFFFFIVDSVIFIKYSGIKYTQINNGYSLLKAKPNLFFCFLFRLHNQQGKSINIVCLQIKDENHLIKF